MAPYDIPPGERYAGSINQAIRGCSSFVLLLSMDAQNSVWVAKECERAVNYCKTVIPIQLEDVVLNDEFELYISSNHAIPLYHIEPNNESMQRIIGAIKACMGIKAEAVSHAAQTSTEHASGTKVRPQASEIKRKIPTSVGYYYGAFPEGGPITGHGEFFYSCGDHYIGDFVDGNFHGHGKYTFANGQYYIGGFSANKFSDGILYDAQGKIVARY